MRVPVQKSRRLEDYLCGMCGLDCWSSNKQPLLLMMGDGFGTHERKRDSSSVGNYIYSDDMVALRPQRLMPTKQRPMGTRDELEKGCYLMRSIEIWRWPPHKRAGWKVLNGKSHNLKRVWTKVIQKKVGW